MTSSHEIDKYGQNKPGEQPTDSRGRVGLLIDDCAHRGLVQNATIQLSLLPQVLDPHDLDPEALTRFEFIIADETVATTVRHILTSREAHVPGPVPALIALALCGSDLLPVPDGDDYTFDGLLPLPQSPSALAAHLGLLLNAHRAFARRNQSVLEELQLNRLIFRSVTSGVSIADARRPDMPLTYVNPAFEAMTGYKIGEVLGKNCRFLQGSLTDQPDLTLVREAIREGREVVANVKNFRKDGAPFWNELFLSPIRNRDGQITHFVGIQNDVTTRVEFESALRESEKLAAVGRLASLHRTRDQQPSRVRHDLIYIAERMESVSEVRQYLAMADQELQRVKLITAQSLRFYKQSTKPQAIQPGDLISSALDLYTARLGNSRITVHRRDLEADSLVCMESEIRQVLNNLISNAIDAMHGRGGHLTVRSRESNARRSGASGILITIADTGIGIDEETQRNMYKAFYTTKGIGGTGLGLWISSEIITRHHGHLRVRSSRRKDVTGTVFHLFLPFESSAPAPSLCS